MLPRMSVQGATTPTAIPLVVRCARRVRVPSWTRFQAVEVEHFKHAATSRMLAHELGHLLELPHIDGARTGGPGQERQVAAWMRNLMYSGALHPDAELTPEQVRLARSSAIARRFGGP